MRVEAWLFECRCDGTRFLAPARPCEFGVLFVRSAGRGTLRTVTQGNQVFEATTRRLATLLGTAGDFRHGQRARQALPLICDPDGDGSRFACDNPPPCPTCGATDVRFVSSLEPPVTHDWSLLEVTHTRWLALTPEAQDRLLLEAFGDRPASAAFAPAVGSEAILDGAAEPAPDVGRPLWLEPWIPIEDGSTWERQLRLEVAPGHPLDGVRARALGRSLTTDEVLFALEGGPAPLAVVHLVFASGPQIPPWPTATLYDSRAAWEMNCMGPDHAQFDA